MGSSLTDEEYKEAGAQIVPTVPSEYDCLRPGLLLFTYLHPAPLPELTGKLLEARVNAVAYETIREADNSLPLLTPMSEVAGRLATQVGAQYLEAPMGGRGIMLGGGPGVAPMWSSSEAESPGAMRRRWQSDWARTRPSSTGISTACASSTIFMTARS